MKIRTETELLKIFEEVMDILVTRINYQGFFKHWSLEGYAEHFKVSQQEAMGQIASSVGLVHECLENSTKTAPFKVVGVIGSFGAHLCNMSEYDGSFVKKFTNDQMEKWHDDFIVALTCGTYKPGYHLLSYIVWLINVRLSITFECLKNARRR